MAQRDFHTEFSRQLGKVNIEALIKADEKANLFSGIFDSELEKIIHSAHKPYDGGDEGSLNAAIEVAAAARKHGSNRVEGSLGLEEFARIESAVKKAELIARRRRLEKKPVSSIPAFTSMLVKIKVPAYRRALCKIIPSFWKLTRSIRNGLISIGKNQGRKSHGLILGVKKSLKRFNGRHR